MHLRTKCKKILTIHFTKHSLCQLYYMIVSRGLWEQKTKQSVFPMWCRERHMRAYGISSQDIDDKLSIFNISETIKKINKTRKNMDK